jgi:integrase
MPKRQRIGTKYPGVVYVETTGGDGKPERAFYVRYRSGKGRAGKQIEEFVGHGRKDRMDALQASRIRGRRIQGDELSNRDTREAEHKAREAEEARWTIQRLWDTYRESKPRTKDLMCNVNRFDLYLKERFAAKEPHELAPLDVDRLRITLAKQRSPQTVRHVLTLLKRIVNFGVNKGLCPGLKFKPEMPTVHNITTEDLNPEQLTRLLDAIEEEPHVDATAMMRLALFTGMRRGEMFKLKWEDIDFDRGFIHIVDPKGGPSQIIPLNDAARDLFMNHPRLSDLHVFPGRNGARRNVGKYLRRIKAAAGLPKDFRPLHGLRHVYASMLASSGQVDMYTLQKLLTHKSPLMTQRYAHLRDEGLRRASNLAGDIIKAANGEPKLRVVEDRTA